MNTECFVEDGCRINAYRVTCTAVYIEPLSSSDSTTCSKESTISFLSHCQFRLAEGHKTLLIFTYILSLYCTLAPDCLVSSKKYSRNILLQKGNKNQIVIILNIKYSVVLICSFLILSPYLDLFIFIFFSVCRLFLGFSGAKLWVPVGGTLFFQPRWLYCGRWLILRWNVHQTKTVIDTGERKLG